MEFNISVAIFNGIRGYMSVNHKKDFISIVDAYNYLLQCTVQPSLSTKYSNPDSMQMMKSKVSTVIHTTICEKILVGSIIFSLVTLNIDVT